jgi:hypothetical protein
VKDELMTGSVIFILHWDRVISSDFDTKTLRSFDPCFPIICFSSSRKKRGEKTLYVATSSRVLSLNFNEESTINDLMHEIERKTEIKADKQLLVNYISDNDINPFLKKGSIEFLYTIYNEQPEIKMKDIKFPKVEGFEDVVIQMIPKDYKFTIKIERVFDDNSKPELYSFEVTAEDKLFFLRERISEKTNISSDKQRLHVGLKLLDNGNMLLVTLLLSGIRTISLRSDDDFLKLNIVVKGLSETQRRELGLKPDDFLQVNVISSTNILRLKESLKGLNVGKVEKLFIDGKEYCDFLTMRDVGITSNNVLECIYKTDNRK